MKLVSLVMLGLVGECSEAGSMENVVVEQVENVVVENVESAGLKDRTFRWVKKNKVVLGTGGVVLAGAAAYLGVRYWKFRVARGRSHELWCNIEGGGIDGVIESIFNDVISDEDITCVKNLVNLYRYISFKDVWLHSVSLRKVYKDNHFEYHYYEMKNLKALKEEHAKKMIDHLGMDCFIKYDLDTSDVK